MAALSPAMLPGRQRVRAVFSPGVSDRAVCAQHPLLPLIPKTTGLPRRAISRNVTAIERSARTVSHLFGWRSPLSCAIWNTPPALQSVLSKATHRSALNHKEGQEVGTSFVLQSDSVSASSAVSNGESTKQCQKCQRLKLVVDFQKSIQTRDGRFEWCRACVASLRAMRKGTCPEYLQLCPDKAWEQSKECCSCKRVKEIRDFGKWVRGVDGLNSRCRSCQSERKSRMPERAPVDIPQQCRLCNEVKAASAFYPYKKTLNGLQSYCKDCTKLDQAKQLRKVEANAKIPRAEKRCGKCGMFMQASEFNRASFNSNGLSNYCKACVNQLSTRRFREKRNM